MKKIVLFGDSLCDMSLSLAEKFDVKIIPLGVTFKGDDRTYFDGVDISKEIIFDRVEKDGVLPSTSAIPPQTFIDAFEKEMGRRSASRYIPVPPQIMGSLPRDVMSAIASAAPFTQSAAEKFTVGSHTSIMW